MDDRSTWPPHSIDAFHRGAFHLVQPIGRGHRAGTDAMILAAAVPSGFGGTVADLGAGAGAAGLAVLSRCPDAHALLVERSPEMLLWARRTLQLPQNRALSPRAQLLDADVALGGAARQAAGLHERSVDFVIMNPPFNLGGDRPSPDPLRREAHVMEAGLFESWLRTAAAILKPGGQIAVIARATSLPELLLAMGNRFGGAQVLPVLPRPDADAIRVVIRAQRGSRAPLALRAPLVVHDAQDRAFSLRAEALANGCATLFGD